MERPEPSWREQGKETSRDGRWPGGRTGLQTPTWAPTICRWLWQPFRCLLHFRFPVRGISTIGQA